MFDKLKTKLKTFAESIKNKIELKTNINYKKEESTLNQIIENKNLKNNEYLYKTNKNISLLKRAKLFIFNGEIIVYLKDIKEQLETLKFELLENDIAFDVCEEIIENITNKLVGIHKKKDMNIELLIENSIKNTLIEILSKNKFNFDNYLMSKKGVLTHILFVGTNGAGKTTCIAKLAYYLKKKMCNSVVIAAGDTYRAGAIDQLEIHSKKLNIKIIKDKNRTDPTSIIYDAVKYCKKNNIDILLSDTSGRMHTNKNLMAQLEKIYRITNPDLVFFIEDATTGNDAIERITYFNNIIPIDGTILTKIDTDSIGGAAVSIAYIINKPILFIGTGQDYSDFKKFDEKWFVDELFK